MSATLTVRQSLNPGSDYYANVRHEMVPFLPDTYRRVLEIGCGDGVFADLLTRPHEMWGVELDPDAAARARPRLHRVLLGTFEQVQHQLPTNYFDLVVCNDVLEHMADPDAFLTAVGAHMTRNGCLIASIPNMRHWQVLWQLLVRKDWQYGREGIMDRTHLRFFTETSMRRMFTDAGFQIERMQGINGVFDRTRRILFGAVTLLSLGHYADTQYRQFGMTARWPR